MFTSDVVLYPHCFPSFTQQLQQFFGNVVLASRSAFSLALCSRTFSSWNIDAVFPDIHSVYRLKSLSHGISLDLGPEEMAWIPFSTSFVTQALPLQTYFVYLSVRSHHYEIYRPRLKLQLITSREGGQSCPVRQYLYRTAKTNIGYRP